MELLFNLPPALKTVILLIGSNLFMTFAWYGHLRFKYLPLWIVIFASWGVAFFEYCLQVPANRIGSDVFSAAQLKVIQECLTFTIFFVFSLSYLKQKPTLYDGLAFLCVLTGVAISLFQPRVSGS